MLKSLMLFMAVTLSSLSVQANEPPVDASAMFTCAIYSGLGQVDNQFVYITAGIILYDTQYGIKAWNKWSSSEEGSEWIGAQKVAVFQEVNDWAPLGEDQVRENFQKKVNDCDIRFGIVDKKTPLKALGEKLGYIKMQ